jgi:ferrous iron transport protein A
VVAEVPNVCRAEKIPQCGCCHAAGFSILYQQSILRSSLTFNKLSLFRGCDDVYDLIPLRCLVPGQTAEVGEILGDPLQVHRLQELGLRHGTRIQMVRSGSPCVLRLGGQKMCFRHTAGLDVLVRPGAAL